MSERTITAQYVDIHNRTIYPAEVTLKNGHILSIQKTSKKAEHYI